jgi:hypothetical protein
MGFVSPFAKNEDGYAETRYIEARRGLHPSVRVTFRPTPILDKANTLDTVRRHIADGRSAKADALIADAMSTRITGWEFLDDDGRAVDGMPKPGKQELLSLKPELFGKLSAIVFYGDSGGDIDPRDGEQPTKPDEQMEIDQKN